MPAKLTARQARGYGIAGKSKYRNRKTVVDGITFDSKKEAERWLVLKDMEAKGHIHRLVRQFPFPLMVNGIKICKYIADFVYRYFPDSGMVVEDVKGYRTPLYRLKKKLFEAINGVKIKEV